MNEIDYHFYSKDKIRFKKGDLLLIPFGKKTPSVYQVIKASKKKLIVVVLEDVYPNVTAPNQKPGDVLDLSRVIYEGYWCFHKITIPKMIKIKDPLVVNN